jgi:hypothetical protein
VTQSESQRPAPRPTQLRVIRMALLGPVILFGAYVAFTVSREPPRAPQMAQPLVYVNLAYLVGAALGIMYFQRRHAAERDPGRRATFNIVAWAIGESTALFGAVHYLLVGSPIPYLVGLATMVASFVLVPVRD